MFRNKIKLLALSVMVIASNTFGQVVNTTPVNLVGSSDPIPGPGGFIMHPFTPSPLTGTYHGGTFYGGTKEKWGYNISGLTPGDTYTLTVYYMMDVVQLTPSTNRVGDLSMLSGAPLSAVLIPYVPPANWQIWYTLTTTFTAISATDRIDIEADGISDNSLWLFTDMAIDGGGACDDLTVTVSTPEFCLGEPLTLTGTSTTGGTVTWDGGAPNGAAFTPGSAGTITYTATSTSANDCPFSTDIIINPLPVVTASADNIAICLGENVTLSGGGATAYAWDSGVTNGVAFSPATTATYTVTGTDANGCENTDDITITVNPLPTINAGLDQDICDGSSVTLSGAGAGAGGSYVWDGGVTDGIAFTPATTATYTVTGTDANGCEGTDAVTITVGAMPIIDAGLDFAICAGNSITLNGTGAGAGGTYSWDSGVTDGTSFTPAATATYTVTGTNIDGCANTDVITVAVNPGATVNAGADIAICDGETVTLSGSGTALAYLWDGGVTDGVSFTPVATTTYTVTGTDANGCTNTDNVIVTVNPLPVINAGTDLILCQGESITLTATGAGAGGTYIWDGGVLNGVSFIPGGTASYNVIGTNANGCVGTDNVNVTVNPLPSVSFNANQTQGCTPFTVNFSTADPGGSFDWNFGDGSTGTGAGTSHTYNNIGSFTVDLTITSIDGCSNTASYANYITVIAQPIASFSYVIDENDVITNSVKFRNESLNATVYDWNFGDGTANESTVDPLHFFPEAIGGEYNVTLVATNDLGCVDSVTQRIIIKDKLLYFVPNAFTPDGDDLNNSFKPVFVSGLNIYDYHLQIFNRWGEIVFESYDVTYGWDGTYGNGGLVEDGSYVWTIEFGETMSDKIHIERGNVTVLK